MKAVKFSKKMKNEREYKVKRDFLKREQEYGHANLSKYTKKWFKMLNEISCNNLRKEALSCWHSFNKAVDYKDMEISLIMDWIEDENQRIWMCLSEHNHRLEHMINFFYKVHKKIYNELGDQVNKLMAIWMKDYSLNKTRAITNEVFLDTMKYQMECTEKREEYETITRKFAYVNEKTTRFKFLLGDIKYALNTKFEKLHWKMRDFTSDYFSSTGQRQKMGAESMEKYECLQRDIVTNLERKAELEQLFRQLVQKYKDVSNQNERKLAGMAKERDTLHESFLILREKLFTDRNNDLLKQQVLCVSFNDSFQKLEELAKKGSVMLKCLTACRRCETSSEKMLPYPEDRFADKYDDSKMDNISHELNLFWNRLASIDASR